MVHVTHTNGLATASVYFFGEVVCSTHDPYASVCVAVAPCGHCSFTAIAIRVVLHRFIERDYDSLPEVDRPTWRCGSIASIVIVVVYTRG